MGELVTVRKMGKFFIAVSQSSPGLQYKAATESQAIAGVHKKLRSRVKPIQPVMLHLLSTRITKRKHQCTPTLGALRNPMAHAGIFKGEAAVVMQEICDEAYKLRNAERDQQGEPVVSVGASPEGLSALFGKYRDDDILTEICDEAYRQRDAATLPGASHDSV